MTVNNLSGQRTIVLLFAVLSGLSAISTAVLPAVLFA